MGSVLGERVREDKLSGLLDNVIREAVPYLSDKEGVLIFNSDKYRVYGGELERMFKEKGVQTEYSEEGGSTRENWYNIDVDFLFSLYDKD